MSDNFIFYGANNKCKNTDNICDIEINNINQSGEIACQTSNPTNGGDERVEGVMSDSVFVDVLGKLTNYIIFDNKVQQISLSFNFN